MWPSQAFKQVCQTRQGNVLREVPCISTCHLSRKELSTLANGMPHKESD